MGAAPPVGRPGPEGITLVLGGTRSGKSAVAERLVGDLAAHGDGSVTYVATASIADAEMERRVAVHRARRPPAWRTVELHSSAELPALLGALDGSVLVDSLGTWVASAPDFEVDGQALAHALRARPAGTVLVSEEVGLSVHPSTAVGRAFVDAVGQLNQAVAAVADHVLLVVAGRTVEL